MRSTVIIPFHRNLAHLSRSLPAARLSLPDAEIIVAADGAMENCRSLAAASGARVLDVAGPSGPAVARNRAAAEASGEILFFVDADVVVAPDALTGMRALLESRPDLAAVFGAYDLDPPELNFMSQYKNLSHACVHESSSPEAATFWAGLGAMRAAVFREVGGFDERFSRPSIEDIELGYRIRRAGHRIRLDTSFRGTHLKRWTLWNSIVTDVVARGVPWTQVLHRYGALANDLNLSYASRASVVLSYMVVLSLALAFWVPSVLSVAAVALILLLVLNRPYYGWFLSRRGGFFTAQVVGAHVVYHLCNGVSFAAGTALHLAGGLGLKLPGALPTTSWTDHPTQ